MPNRRVIGIDPGVARLGWAVLETKGSQTVLIGCGCLETAAGTAPEKRLHHISQKLSSLLKEYRPTVMGVEKLYFTKNVSTGMAVSQARGVVLVAAAAANVAVIELTPTTVKQTVTGDGRADKRQMGRMIQLLFKLKHLPQHDDTTDAIAIALCVASTNMIH